MQGLFAGLFAAAVLSLTLDGATVADTDPTVHQIYEAASSGHLNQAQQMIDQVLRDHPESAKAHYVQAELYAREGKPGLARSELARAEQLSPGLPKENPRSVAKLESELGTPQRADPTLSAARQSTARFPWGTVLILVLVVGVFFMLFRRRNSYPQYSPTSGAPAAAGSNGPGSYGPGSSPGAGGIGSTVAGGLAGGLAAGAGLVAGEALAHRFLDNGRESAATSPPEFDRESGAVNSDMGGEDFGVNDPGSWDDGSASNDDGVGGGGDDWS
jgi:uncharacterized protein